MRIALALALLLSIFVHPVANAATCLESVPEPPGLDVVRDALNVLSVQYFEPIQSDELLTAAADSLYEAANHDLATPLNLPVAGPFGSDDNLNWAQFSEDYCLAYVDSPPGTAGDSLAYSSIRGMVNVLDEAHTAFLTPPMYEAHQRWAAGDQAYEGIGARLRSDPLTIQYIFPGSPADEAGMQPGDQILAVDGEPVADLTATEVATFVRGEAGTPVSIAIQRQGEAAPRTFELIRASVKVPSLESRVIGDVGYLRIQDFPVPALYDDVLTELNRFNDLALKGLILDLRANSGGRTDVGSRVASLFLERDTPIYLSTSRRGQTSARRATPPNQVWTRPVTVLVDGGTASMGEILAATLQEQGIAQLVGETTAGAVAGSIVIPLIDGSALQVTTVRIDSGLGRVLNNIGVEPDIDIPVVPDDLRGGADPQLDTAMTVLRAQINAAGAPAAPPAPAAVAVGG